MAGVFFFIASFPTVMICWDRWDGHRIPTWAYSICVILWLITAAIGFYDS